MLNKKIIVDGLLINYYQSQIFDREHCVVFLHGWGVDAGSMRSVWENTENAIAFDWPGFGGSQMPLSVWNVGKYADFLSKFLEKLNIVNPTLVGHSFGGRVIIKYCSVVSGQVRKIILIDSAGIKDRSWKIEILSRLSSSGQMLKKVPGVDGMINKLGKKLQSKDYLSAGANRDNFKSIIAEDLQGDLSNIKSPATIIWGGDDLETPLSDGNKMNKIITGSKFYVIEGAGHYPFVDKFDAFMEVFKAEVKQ